MFRNAKKEEAAEILALYQSAIGGKFCSWNESYPTMLEINHDLEADNLYVLTDEDDKIIGAVSIPPENELDDFFPQKADARPMEIARIVVSTKHRNQGLSRRIVSEILSVLQSRGCTAVRLSVAKTNIPAQCTYRRLGFRTEKEVFIYGGEYYLLEKPLI